MPTSRRFPSTRRIAVACASVLLSTSVTQMACLGAGASPARDEGARPRVVVERATPLPDGAVSLGAVRASTPITLDVALEPRDPAALAELRRLDLDSRRRGLPPLPLPRHLRRTIRRDAHEPPRGAGRAARRRHRLAARRGRPAAGRGPHDGGARRVDVRDDHRRRPAHGRGDAIRRDHGGHAPRSDRPRRRGGLRALRRRPSCIERRRAARVLRARARDRDVRRARLGSRAVPSGGTHGRGDLERAGRCVRAAWPVRARRPRCGRDDRALRGGGLLTARRRDVPGVLPDPRVRRDRAHRRRRRHRQRHARGHVGRRGPHRPRSARIDPRLRDRERVHPRLARPVDADRRRRRRVRHQHELVAVRG